jgi:putative OPT family oligopeptide transporter
VTSQRTPAAEPRTELTVRGIILGIIITVVFTAANVFFGLKVGLTFATSIPAAVISMALLRGFKDSTIQENNIVQTVASAAGTLSGIVFVLPGFVMIGVWEGFPFWTSFAICALGGILGVMYSIPLRRALVTGSDLPYPEGVACAEVLKVGSPGEEGTAQGAEESRAGLFAVIWGSIVAAVFAVIVATRVFASDVAQFFRFGSDERGPVSGFDFNLSMALFGVGHLVGLWVGVAMGVGALIGWGFGVPYYSWIAALAGDAAKVAETISKSQLRFVGAGTIGLAAIWTLLKLVKPVASGLTSAMAASRARKSGQGDLLPRTEHDIPVGTVGLIMLICFVPITWLLASFADTSGLGDHVWALAIGGLIYCVLMSFFVSAVTGYMAGLIGASNSPLSGVGILVVIGAALLLVFGIKPYLPAGSEKALVAYALFVTSIVFAVATIANNNLQDLKTGQLVDATPSKQQWALVIGVIAGAAIIPPILDVLNQAYGFSGGPGAHEHPLSAPQAGLISALAQGVIAGNIDWSLITVGAIIGVVIIGIDELLRRTTKSAHLSPLAVGLGIYLPTSATLMVVVGAIAGWYYDQRAERTAKPESAKQLGILLASGMIVGEGLIGVVIATIVAFSGKDFPLDLVGDEFAGSKAVWIGGIAFVLAMLAMYYWVEGLARKTAGVAK